MKIKQGEEIELFTYNIIWEPELSPFEKILLLDLQYKCRLIHEASTESNKTIGIRLGREKAMTPEHISYSLSGIAKKGWCVREQFYGLTQRFYKISEQTVCMITMEYIDWYYLRVGKFKLPKMTVEELQKRIGKTVLDKHLPRLINEGLINE
jgi:hypothetical protein